MKASSVSNIFTKAKFGDKFLTRDNRLALYIAENPYSNSPIKVVVGDSIYCYHYNGLYYDNAECSLDIVSTYDTIYDDAKLSKYADQYFRQKKYWEGYVTSTKNAYKAGYLDALKENNKCLI